MFTRLLYLFGFYIIILIINGCSSGREVKNENKSENKSENIRVKEIFNHAAEERKYIKENKIKEIEKVSFILDENGNPVKGETSKTWLYDRSSSSRFISSDKCDMSLIWLL